MRRDKCLYCEQRGEETKLIPLGHWAFCPTCDPARAQIALLHLNSKENNEP